jgi:hypothetical protein
MDVRLMDDDPSFDLSRVRAEDLLVRRVDAPGELLDASYELLTRVFDPAVIDRKETYVEALTNPPGDLRDFPPIHLAALLSDGAVTRLAGFISSNLMKVGSPPERLLLAIGNIATSPRLKAAGFRGVGSTLWKAAVRGAQDEAEKLGKRVDFSAAEAEPASLPFWAKLGYRWPEGVKYFQPPLEFDDAGRPIYPEVPETLLIHTLEAAAESIDVGELCAVIRAIYWNWGIRPSKRKLTPEALAAATEYVMGKVFTRTRASLPETGAVRLVAVPTSRVH